MCGSRASKHCGTLTNQLLLLLQSWGKTSAIQRALSDENTYRFSSWSRFPSGNRGMQGVRVKIGWAKIGQHIELCWNISKITQIHWFPNFDAAPNLLPAVYHPYLCNKISRWNDSHKEHDNTLACALKYIRELCTIEVEKHVSVECKGLLFKHQMIHIGDSTWLNINGSLV